MATIRVPRTPKRAFNKDRKPSALLLDQIKHLEWAALPAAQRKPAQLKKYRKAKTEAQAAERVAQLTTLIQYQQEQERTSPPPRTGVQPVVVLPPLPRVPASKAARRRKSKPRRKAKSRRKVRASRRSKGTSRR